MASEPKRKKEGFWKKTGKYAAKQAIAGTAVGATHNAYRTGSARIARRAAVKKEIGKVYDAVEKNLNQNTMARAAQEKVAQAETAKASAIARQREALGTVRQANGRMAAARKGSARAWDKFATSKARAIREAGGSKFLKPRSTTITSVIPNAGGGQTVTVSSVASKGTRLSSMPSMKAASRGMVSASRGIESAASGVSSAAKGYGAARQAVASASRELQSSKKVLSGIVNTFQKQADDIAAKALSAAPDATRFQKFVVGAGDKVKGAISGSAPSGVKKAIAINPFASKAQIAANLAKEGRVGKAALTTARGVAKLGKAGKFVAGAIPKGIAGTFNTVGRLSNAVLGTSKAANLVRGMTSASGLAGGFAMQAWMDAGSKAYDFFKDGGKVSDFKHLVANKTETINGHEVQTMAPMYKNGAFWSTFAKESLKGLQSALTLGTTGTGDDTWLDRKFDGTPEEIAAAGAAQYSNGMLKEFTPSPKEGLLDVDGNPVYSQEEIGRENAMLAKAHAKGVAAVQFKRAATSGSLDAQNLRAMMAGLATDRQKALDAVAENVKNYESFSRENAKTLRGMTAEQYEKSATANADSEYSRRMGMLLSNKASGEVMKQNRADAYRILTGRVYDDDSKARLPSDMTEDFKAFNRMWYDKSDADRLSWDKDAAQKEYDDAIAAAEHAANPEEK